VLVSPLIGAICDRLTLRMGRRRPLIMAGTVTLCIGLLGMALSAPDIQLSQHEVTSNSSLSKLKNATDVLISRTDLKLCHIDLEERRCRQYQRHVSPNTTLRVTHEAPAGYRAPGAGSDQGQAVVVGSVVGHPQGVLLPRYSGAADTPPSGGSLGLYIVFFLVVTGSQAAIAVPFNALVADMSPPSQRGFNSGVMGAMILLGNIGGAITGTMLTRIGVLNIYATIIGVLVVCILISCFSVQEHPPIINRKTEPLGIKKILSGYWTPLKDHDFRWVFLTRFLLQMGVGTITGFLQYWLQDMIPLPYCMAPPTAVAMLMLPLLAAAAGSSIIFGAVSDKTGYRKIIVTIASFMMGLGSFINAFLSGDYSYYLAAIVSFIIGLGFGAFQSVDFALVMDVLQREDEKANDIAVWHQALVLPQALATPLGGVILDVFQRQNCHVGLGYILLFLLTAAYCFSSGAFVYRIKRAR